MVLIPSVTGDSPRQLKTTRRDPDLERAENPAPCQHRWPGGARRGRIRRRAARWYDAEPCRTSTSAAGTRTRRFPSRKMRTGRPPTTRSAIPPARSRSSREAPRARWCSASPGTRWTGRSKSRRTARCAARGGSPTSAGGGRPRRPPGARRSSGTGNQMTVVGVGVGVGFESEREPPMIPGGQAPAEPDTSTRMHWGNRVLLTWGNGVVLTWGRGYGG